MVYKFPQLSREEIERMFGLSELRQTKVFQEALQEGEEKGRQEGLMQERSLIFRQLARRIGNVSPELRSQVEALSLAQIEALGEALLDFEELSDLVDWLETNGLR
jgi:predicted transposase YdaD